MRRFLRILLIILIIIGLILLYLYYLKPMFGRKATIGDTITLEYEGRLADNVLFDTNVEKIASGSAIYDPMKKYEPITFRLGSGQMIKGIEQSVMGMRAGESKKITVMPADGYGEYMPEKIKSSSMAPFTQGGTSPEIGKVYEFTYGMAKVIGVSGDRVILDYNHALAGKALYFTITVKSIERN